MDTTIQFEEPVVLKLEKLPVPEKAIIHRMGYPAGKEEIDAGVRHMLDTEIQKTSELVSARGVVRFLKVEERSIESLSFKNTDFIIRSRQVCKMLKASDPVILFMVTIGKLIEDEISRLQQQGEVTEGFILDAVASEMADAAADKLHRDILKKVAEINGFSITPRYSPGYGDWPVTVQKEILQICGGEKIGISVNASSLMSPRKSVSAIIGFK